MKQNIFIQMPLEEFNAKIEATVKQTMLKVMAEYNLSQNQDLVTTDDLTRILKCSKMAIHNWRKEGWLPFYKLGGKVIFNLEEVMSAIQKRSKSK